MGPKTPRSFTLSCSITLTDSAATRAQPHCDGHRSEGRRSGGDGQVRVFRGRAWEEGAVVTSCPERRHDAAGSLSGLGGLGDSLLTGPKSPWLTLASENGRRLGNRMREKESSST